MMLSTIALMVLAAGNPAAEDAAHRADRLRTQALNTAAAAVVTKRQRSDTALDRDYRGKQARYERDMAAWRDREAARRRYNDSIR